jgi:chromosome segregation ATPase
MKTTRKKRQIVKPNIEPIPPVPYNSTLGQKPLYVAAPDPEWQRLLFERFRLLCRDEMTDVIRALLSSGAISTELNQKLDAVQTSTDACRQLMLDASDNLLRKMVLRMKAPITIPPVELQPSAVEAIVQQSVAKQYELVENTRNALREVQNVLSDIARQGAARQDEVLAATRSALQDVQLAVGEVVRQSAAKQDEAVAATKGALQEVQFAVDEVVRQSAAKQDEAVEATKGALQEVQNAVGESVRQSVAKQDEAVEATKGALQQVQGAVEKTRSSAWKAAIFSVFLTLLFCSGGVAGLHYLGGFSLQSKGDVQKEMQSLKKKSELELSIKTLSAGKKTIEDDIKQLEGRREALNAEVHKSVGAQRNLAAILTAVEQRIKSVQELQDQYRFKLVRGEKEGVYAEIESGVRPVIHEGKTYIKIK